MKMEPHSRTGRCWPCHPQAGWVPCCQAGARLGTLLRDTVPRGLWIVVAQTPPQPVLCLLWATPAPSQHLGPGSSPAGLSAGSRVPLCQRVPTWGHREQPSGPGWNGPVLLPSLPELTEMLAVEISVLYICFIGCSSIVSCKYVMNIVISLNFL